MPSAAYRAPLHAIFHDDSDNEDFAFPNYGIEEQIQREMPKSRSSGSSHCKHVPPISIRVPSSHFLEGNSHGFTEEPEMIIQEEAVDESSFSSSFDDSLSDVSSDTDYLTSPEDEGFSSLQVPKNVQYDEKATMRRASRQVDFLSRDWDEEDSSMARRRSMQPGEGSSNRDVRLENALWRAWNRAICELQRFPPCSLDWAVNLETVWRCWPPISEGPETTNEPTMEMNPLTLEDTMSRKSQQVECLKKGSGLLSALASPGVPTGMPRHQVGSVHPMDRPLHEDTSTPPAPPPTPLKRAHSARQTTESYPFPPSQSRNFARLAYRTMQSGKASLPKASHMTPTLF
ncbi:MAG: hypothetical protein M4579_003001 [Chaenotheca gracillima]|nr:MAG: hypothetical protein M4579_003001 [Chaenotheca gracillima]